MSLFPGLSARAPSRYRVKIDSESSVFPKDVHKNLESVFISVNLWLKAIVSHSLVLTEK
jgi:hypothetical protein